MNIKQLSFGALMLLSILPVSAQEDAKFSKIRTTHLSQIDVVGVYPKAPVKEDEGEELVYDIVEINAEFPGGDEVLMKWLSNNLQYPENCIKKGIKGKVIVSFVVNGNGDVKEVKVVRSPDKELSKEVVRVVKAMPKWNPARQIHNDKVLKTINASFTLPIFFRLPQTGL